MRNKKLTYYLINMFFILGAIFLVNYRGTIGMNFSIQQIIPLILMLALIHLFKFIRIYFILLEERIPIKRMAKIYIKTTFVSIVFPYKLGEVFKMYSFGNEINSYPKGTVAVLIDKLFDAIILCAVLIPYEIIKVGKISKLSLLLLVFIVVILLIYLCFEGTYKYLNKFFIIQIKSKKGLFVLKVLEESNNIFNYSKNMIKGRQIVLLAISALIWLLESIFIYIIAGFIDMIPQLITIIEYISDAFLGINNILFNKYVYLCTVGFLVIIILIYMKKFISGGVKIWKK